MIIFGVSCSEDENSFITKQFKSLRDVGIDNLWMGATGEATVTNTTNHQYLCSEVAIFVFKYIIP